MTAEQPCILIVEDEDIARRNLEYILKKEGYAVVGVNSGEKAIKMIGEQEFDLIMTDLKMEKVDGMQVLAEAKKRQPHTEVVVITGYATVQSAVDAMKTGAYYYIAKPYKIEEVRKVAHEGILKRRLMMENLDLKARLETTPDIPSIIGQSESIKEILKTIRQVAGSDSNILILGESGTGKELAAKAVHSLSIRSEKSFVAFNCGSFTEDLMANELFGHEKDAFTGATRAKTGLLESADGGTVFLDEVGDMPMSMQVKLLRVIQEKEVMRVGGVTPIPVDVRFIAATHQDLNDDVEQRRFRHDLYYRLNVITLTLPPLAEREGDIPLLAYHFLQMKTRSMGKQITRIDKAALDLMTRYSWPGNVRELENTIERAVALEDGPAVTVDGLPEYFRNMDIETYRKPSSAIPTLADQEINYIRWVLKKCDGNKSKAAKIMDIDRVSLWRKIKRYGIE